MKACSKSIRLDQLLVDRAEYSSREKAKRAVMAGCVEVGGRLVDKPGTGVPVGADVRVLRRSEPFVSRAGRKLDAALDRFCLDPTDAICIDIGASTGGFTDCLLQRGAKRVYAVDVGRGQLDFALYKDSRVVVMDRVNARYLDADAFPEEPRLITVDVSFISLLKVVPALLPLLAPGADLVTLIKPQFEAPRGALAKGGILRDEALREQVVDERSRQIAELGLDLLGLMESPVAGRGGNREALAHFRRGAP